MGGIAKKTVEVTTSVAKKTASGVVGGTTTLFKQVGNLLDDEVQEIEIVQKELTEDEKFVQMLY